MQPNPASVYARLREFHALVSGVMGDQATHLNSNVQSLSLGLADKLTSGQQKQFRDTVTVSHFLRGEVCFVRNELASALEHYRAADDRTDGKTPNRVYTAFGENFTQLDIWAKLGLCYQRLGKFDRANEMGKRILARDPNHKLGHALSELS